ncbi:MAG: TatD family hydrolase [Proteobacteria bacterium]|nr:TatD family hydrolase [Pseudomonadota bacterium]
MSSFMIDAHAHLSDLRLAPKLDSLIPQLRSRGLGHLVLGGVRPDEWQRQFDILSAAPGFITPVAGIHPWTVRESCPEVLEEMFKELERFAPTISAIGELGVDFAGVMDPIQRMKQPEWAERQLDLATTHAKPVVLHVVRGHDVMLGLLRQYRGKPGIVHGWRGSEQDGKKYIDRAFVLSISLRSIAKLKPSDLAWIPAENFVLETDGPDFMRARDGVPDARAWTTALKEVAHFMGKALKLPSDQIWALNRDNIERILSISFITNTQS